MTDREFAQRVTTSLARGISRREFIGLALAAGLSLPAARRLHAGAAHAAPKKGGVLRLALGHGATTDSLDPATYPDQFTGTAMWGTLSNSLTEVDAQGNAIPELAESVESSDGAKKWVVTLRKGLTFHKGKPVTSADVVGSFQHHMGEGSKSAAASVLKPIRSIKADGPLSVAIELEAGNADFPFLLSDYHLPIMPVVDGKVDWASGDRTGPYVLQSFEPGVKATFKRNPNYFKSDRAHFDEVVMLSIHDVAARSNALVTGDIDYMDSVDLRTVGQLRKQKGIAISEVTGFGHYLFAMNVTVPPFDNVDVRSALKHAVDREEIVRKVFLGHGLAGNDNPIAPGIKFAIDPKPRHVYDPDKARSFLRKAGFETLKIDLTTAEAAFAGSVDAALLWKEQAAQAGIDLNVIRAGNDGYWDNVWMKKPFFGSYWGGRPTADWMFTAVYAADAPWNETQWKHPRFNELLVEARSELDEAKRAAMYAEMQQLVQQDGGTVNLMFTNFVDAHSDRLKHGDLAANWPLDGLKIAERWWFES